VKNFPLPKISSRNFFGYFGRWKKLVKEHPILFWLLLITAFDNFFVMGPAWVGAPALITQEMGLPWASFAFYEILICSGIFAMSSWFYHHPPKRLLLTVAWGLTLDGLTHIPYIFVQWTGNLYLLYGIALFHALMIPVLMIPRTTWIQNQIHPSFQGRIFALIGTLVLGVSGLSCALTGWLMAEKQGIFSTWHLTASEAFSYGGVGAAFCGLLAAIKFRKNEL
jgi:hypothetical protein